MAADGDMLLLGTLRVDLVATVDGDMQVRVKSEGNLQYITAVGMLEMAKGQLDDLVVE